MPRLLLSPCRGMHESRKAELSRLDRTALCAQVLCSAQQLGRWLNEYFARRWWNSSGSSGSSSSRSRSSGSGGHRCLFPSESVPRSAAVYYPDAFLNTDKMSSLALSLHGPARTDQWVINSGDPKCIGGGTAVERAEISETRSTSLQQLPPPTTTTQRSTNCLGAAPPRSFELSAHGCDDRAHVRSRRPARGRRARGRRYV
jgi:hypothetical protein